MQSIKELALLQQLPTALMYKRRGEEHFHLNDAFIKLFGISSEQLSSVRNFCFFDPINKSQLTDTQCPFEKIEKEAFPTAWVRLQTPARSLHCFITGSVIADGDDEWLIINVESNAHYAMAESEEGAHAQRHITFNQLLTKFSSKLIKASADELDVIIGQSLAAFGEFCDVDRCYLFEFSQELSLMSNTHEWVAAGVTPYIDDLQNMPTSDMPFLMEHITEGMFKVDDVKDIPDSAIAEREEFQKEGICSILCMRITVDGNPYGFIGCDIIGSPYTWCASDIEYLKRIGDMLGNTLQNIYNRRAIHAMQQELVEANKQLQKLANIDGLTGIANRRLFNTTLEKDLSQSCRRNESISLLLIDVDFFKLYNDNYGHVAGDHVLQQVALTISESCIGTDDLVARYGGEEFAIILPATTTDDAEALAKRILDNVKRLGIEHERSPHNKLLTVSVGVATQDLACDETCSDLVNKADRALYRAKSAGRNCVSQ